MKLKPTTTLTAIILFAIMQSCTVPNPYQPIDSSTNSSTSPKNNNESDNDEDDDDNSSAGTTTGGSSGTTTGGTTTGTGTSTTGGIILSGNSSTSGGNKSHNMGQNCMNCHNPGGSGKGVWQIGGTVYNQAGTVTVPNAVIKFYTGPNGTGTLKYTLNADSRGNLYSVGPVDFTGGLYPAVTGSTTTQYMSSSISSGACNSCHTGSSTARIWAQ